MPRPARDHVDHAHEILRQLDPHLTLDQVRTMVRCADACGLTVGVWILECAQVQAAAVTDAIQATERQRREAVLAGNEMTNARNRERRRAVKRGAVTT